MRFSAALTVFFKVYYENEISIGPYCSRTFHHINNAKMEGFNNKI